MFTQSSYGRGNTWTVDHHKAVSAGSAGYSVTLQVDGNGNILTRQGNYHAMSGVNCTTSGTGHYEVSIAREVPDTSWSAVATVKGTAPKFITTDLGTFAIAVRTFDVGAPFSPSNTPFTITIEW